MKHVIRATGIQILISYLSAFVPIVKPTCATNQQTHVAISSVIYVYYLIFIIREDKIINTFHPTNI